MPRRSPQGQLPSCAFVVAMDLSAVIGIVGVVIAVVAWLRPRPAAVPPSPASGQNDKDESLEGVALFVLWFLNRRSAQRPQRQADSNWPTARAHPGYTFWS